MEKPPSIQRQVTIGICTSSLRPSIKALIAKFSGLTNVTVRFIELPSNDHLDNFRLPSAGLDGVIICHSINNHRFAITDVMDALYDKFLPHVRQEFGKGNVCVVAHDFTWPMKSGGSPKDHAKIKDSHMDNFRSNQPTIFESCDLAMICGRLDKQVDMDKEDWTQLEVFVRQCRAQAQPKKKTEFIINVHGYAIDLSDPRILGLLISVIVALVFLLPFAKRFLYRSLEVVAYYAVLFLLVPFICRVYHSRGKGPQVFKNERYWGIILASSILINIYVAVRLHRAGGMVALLFPLVLFIGLVYQRRRKGARGPRILGFSAQGTFQWSKPPWWKFPYRFWCHFLNAGAKYVNSLF